MLKPCSFPGCGLPSQGGRCPKHRARAEKLKGSSTQRGYGKKHRRKHGFRERVLERDLLCVICRMRQATVADHWPKSRRQLVAEGLNPDDPAYGRGLCQECDHLQTAQRQPGGWNAEQR